MKILFSGGGTGGSVMPLLAIFEEMVFQNLLSKEDVLWLGTKHGGEKRMIKKSGIQFQGIVSGKWRRYLSLWNILDALFIFFGFVESLWMILRFQPDVVVTAGGFVSVPVVCAAWILRKKILVHQQDIRKGLANKLMAPFASRITVTFEKSLEEFPIKKVVLTGNPVRASMLIGSREEAKKIFGLEDEVSTILVTGGGTGAENLNRILVEVVPEIIKFAQVIHLTGIGKRISTFESPRYHVYEMLTGEMTHALASADLVVSRAGLSTLSELSLLGKASIIIPIRESHQEENAEYFRARNAIVCLGEKHLTPENFVSTLREILCYPERRQQLQENIQKIMLPNGRENVVREILKLLPC